MLGFRGNTGGDSPFITPLVNDLESRAAALLANPQFQVYEVIDKGTFSSALDDAMNLKVEALALAVQTPGLDVGSHDEKGDGAAGGDS